MGRGSARSKAGGGSHSKDVEWTMKPAYLNITLLEFLRQGQFERDLLTYCANRLTEYTCVYWLDPSSSRKHSPHSFRTGDDLEKRTGIKMGSTAVYPV
ncbi:unnamed protein product [Protopolystoma xenopodis]|uniref:Uncharacterized protein n=1 Tax=Protopolystoma xenopodis TaxID=117903 RepID=A0A448WHA8_9PLAT|nr:unnamed protein product [Protopolystoma xenopodis]